MTTFVLISTIALSLVAAPDPNQEKFDALVKEFGSAIQSTTSQGNSKLRSMLQAGASVRFHELSQFLKSLGPDAAKLRLTDNPLAKLASRLEIGKEIYADGRDSSQQAIELCVAAIKETDPLLREAALQKLEQHLRRMGDRQEAIPDDAMITTDVTLTLDIEELFLSPLKNIKLTELPNQNLRDLYTRLLKTRTQLINAQDENIAWLADQQKSFGEALAAAGILPQGTFLGRAEVTGGSMAISEGANVMQAKIPRQAYFAQVKVTLVGTQVQGVITFGEGDTRSAARISGTLDPATSRLTFRAVDPTLRGLPGLTVEEFKLAATGGVATAASLSGDFQLALNITGKWEEDGVEKSARIVLSAIGTWQANR